MSDTVGFSPFFSSFPNVILEKTRETRADSGVELPTQPPPMSLFFFSWKVKCCTTGTEVMVKFRCSRRTPTPMISFPPFSSLVVG